MSQPILDITAEALASLLSTKAIGRSLLTLDSTESTNLTAAELAPVSPHGLVVVAVCLAGVGEEEQVGGAVLGDEA